MIPLASGAQRILQSPDLVPIDLAVRVVGTNPASGLIWPKPVRCRSSLLRRLHLACARIRSLKKEVAPMLVAARIQRDSFAQRSNCVRVLAEE